MLLAIDAGNTNTVFAVYDGEELKGLWRCSTDTKRTADEYAVWLTQLMSLIDLTRAQISQAIIASVVPEAVFNLVSLCRRYFDTQPLVVGEPGVELGIKVLLDNPSEVGADRVVNAVAARERFGAPLVVVDLGTATTFDVIDADGNYAGGCIAPGINLSLQALYMAAAKLPRIAIRHPEKVIGRSTIPAMQSGIFWGYVGLIEGILTRMAEELGYRPTVVATGGLAPMFAEATQAIDHIDGDLTLWGLRLIYARNRSA